MDGWMDGRCLYSEESVRTALIRMHGRNHPLLRRKSVPKSVPTIALVGLLVHSYVVGKMGANHVETEAACLSRETKHQMILSKQFHWNGSSI
jgi:hypothetical protein